MTSGVLADLGRYGFAEAGEWRLRTTGRTLRSGVEFRLDRFSDQRVIYAFVVGHCAKYVGICEKTNLCDRMKGYMYRYTRSEEAIAAMIKSALQQRQDVTIWALTPRRACRYRGLLIDMVRALEYPLMGELGTTEDMGGWNRRFPGNV